MLMSFPKNKASCDRSFTLFCAEPLSMRWPDLLEQCQASTARLCISAGQVREIRADFGCRGFRKIFQKRKSAPGRVCFWGGRPFDDRMVLFPGAQMVRRTPGIPFVSQVSLAVLSFCIRN